MHLFNYLLVLSGLTCISHVSGYDDYYDDYFTTTTELIETTTKEGSAQLWARLVNVGVYTTIDFHYQNSQQMRKKLLVPERDTDFKNPDAVIPTIDSKDNETCIDSYIACVVSQTAPQPVCAFNDAYDDPALNYWTSFSYCDVYFNNCKRGYRVWRIVGRGQCIWTKLDWDDEMSPYILQNVVMMGRRSPLLLRLLYWRYSEMARSLRSYVTRK